MSDDDAMAEVKSNMSLNASESNESHSIFMISASYLGLYEK